MENRNKIFLIAGIIIGIVISATFYGIIVLIKSIENDYTRHTFYLKAREEDIKYCYIISFSNDILDTIIFSFTTEPNGVIEVSYEIWGVYAPFLNKPNITDYELILLEIDSSLRFCNLNWFGIEVSVKYKIEQLV